MTMIGITNVVNISVIIPPAGLAAYSINNLVCFTKETPAVSLGTALFAVYSSAADVITNWGSASETAAAATAIFSQSPNILTGGGYFIVVPMLAGEVLEEAITRASGLLYFGGCSANYTLGVTGPSGFTGATGANLEALRAGAVAQSAGKLLFLADSAASSLQNGGLAYEVDEASLSMTRVLHYARATGIDGFKWSYAGRAMSTNFSAVNTAQTMNLKSLAGVSSDDAMTQTILTAAKAVGADCYVNIAGQACVMSHGANEFFDDVYNLRWIIGALEVAGFNYLRTVGTKIPQTEQGMVGLKGAYRSVCSLAASNGFLAPGEWTGADTFGDPEDFKRNIREFGYCIYSLPVSVQSSADRLARVAPTVQIAIKYSGAIHSSNVIVNINK